jgi:hypothetical protein
MVAFPRLMHCALPGLLLLGAVAMPGCGGVKYYSVTGKVTLDGEPLAEATIAFVPVSAEGGIRTMAFTDEQGYYSLYQTFKQSGAPAAKYRVAISTFFDGTPEAEPPIPPRPERVPMKYNRETELIREVKPGENVIDFELDSDGEIFQPDPEK